MTSDISDNLDLIKQALSNFNNDNFKENAIFFFKTLGYKSGREIPMPISSPNEFYLFINEILEDSDLSINKDKLIFNKWKKCYELFQYTQDDLNNLLAEYDKKLDETYDQNYIFYAIELIGFFYKEQELSTISKEINKFSVNPIIIIFKYADKIALSVTKRRKNKFDIEKYVIENSIIRIKSYKQVSDIDAKFFADLSIYKLIHTQSLKKKVYIKQNIIDNDTNNKSNVYNIENHLMNDSIYDDYDEIEIP